MPDSSPDSGRLHAVPQSDESQPPVPEESRDGVSRVLLWGLGLAAVLLAMLLAAQIQRNGQLTGQIDALGAEVDAARERVSLYQERLGDIRSAADGLAAQVEALRMLAAEPGSEPGPAPGGAPEDERL